MKQTSNHRSRAPRQLRPVTLALIDVGLIVASLLVFALVDHVIPRARQDSVPLMTVQVTVSPTPIATMPPEAAQEAPSESAVQAGVPSEAPADTTMPVAAAIGDFSQKFADKFTTGEVIWTDTSYQSANLNITLTKQTGKIGDYKEVCYIQDIYVRNIECLRTIFAKDTYGRSITEDVLPMSKRAKAVGAINADFYSFGASGVVIRNGVLYNDRFPPDLQVLIIYRSGAMEVYRKSSELDVKQAMADGAWQSFCFGPNLLDENGEPFAHGYKRTNHDPRTILGMIEPGHYLFITIDGRQNNYSAGMTYEECAMLCQSLGCKVAFNLDGGKSSQMTFMNKMVNHPYKGGRDTSELLYVGEPLA